MIGGGSGRTGGGATRGAEATGAEATRGASGTRAASWVRGEASPVPRRRSIAARARSLASRCWSTGAAASAGRTVLGAATTGAAAGADLTIAFSRWSGGWGWRVSTGMLAVSVNLSAGFSATAGFSMIAGLSAAVFSRMAFSEMPLAVTPGAGILPSIGGCRGRPGIDLHDGRFRARRRHRGGGRRLRGGPCDDVMIDDVGPDNGRRHRRQHVHRHFREVFQHAGQLPAPGLMREL